MKQQGEIAALNRAQEKAEARVSSIHHQLTTSESELSVLEGEMAEVCTIQPTIAFLGFPCNDEITTYSMLMTTPFRSLISTLS